VSIWTTSGARPTYCQRHFGIERGCVACGRAPSIYLIYPIAASRKLPYRSWYRMKSQKVILYKYIYILLHNTSQYTHIHIHIHLHIHIHILCIFTYIYIILYSSIALFGGWLFQAVLSDLESSTNFRGLRDLRAELDAMAIWNPHKSHNCGLSYMRKSPMNYQIMVKVNYHWLVIWESIMSYPLVI
jgi:hypothetical protein